MRRAIAGEIDGIVPYASLVGSHRVLTSVYGFSNEDASRLMDRFMDAKRIHWYGNLDEETVRAGLERAGVANVDGWDGYYAQVAVEEGAETIVTIDDDFDGIDGVSAEVILSAEEFAILNEYLG